MTANAKPTRFRSNKVTMTDNIANTSLLCEMCTHSQWRVVGRSRSGDGTVTIQIKVPVGARQHITWPVLRQRGWAIQPAARRKLKTDHPRKNSRRFPRPLPEESTVFGKPANARRCGACDQWFRSQYMWNPSTREFKPCCPRCSSFRRERRIAVATRIDPPDAPWRQKS